MSTRELERLKAHNDHLTAQMARAGEMYEAQKQAHVTLKGRFRNLQAEYVTSVEEVKILEQALNQVAAQEAAADPVPQSVAPAVDNPDGGEAA